MAAKYKKIDPRMWNDEKFRSLDNTDKLIAIYVITTQSNRIGLFVFSVLQACEDLEIDTETFRQRFQNVVSALKWRWDAPSRVLFLPSWWKYNSPDNPNTMKGCLDDTHDLPQTNLLSEFCDNTKYIEKKHVNVWRTFVKKNRNVTHQEHKQEQEQEHEQEQEGLRARPQRPTFEEVRAYCEERKNGVDARKWFDHYTSNGWKVGRNSMKDWRAAVRTWEKKDFGPAAPIKQRVLTDEEVEERNARGMYGNS